MGDWGIPMMAEQQHDLQLRIERNQHSFVVDHDTPERTATVLIDAVASLRDVDQTELEPLYDTVDPEAIDALCTGPDTDCSLRISFQYEGYAVTISGDGRIRLVDTSEGN